VRNQAVFSFVPDWQCSIGSPKGHTTKSNNDGAL
jgi:hypothetical protein